MVFSIVFVADLLKEDGEDELRFDNSFYDRDGVVSPAYLSEAHE